MRAVNSLLVAAVCATMLGCEQQPASTGSAQPDTKVMNWLITTKQDIDLETLDQVLEKHGFHREAERKPVPLGEGEQSIEIVGPESSESLSAEEIILGTYPNSNVTIDKE